MRTGNSGKWFIAICGLNCAKCDIYLASHGNEKSRDEIVEWFKKERDETIKREQITCEGCRGSLDVHWNSKCRMMLCARTRGLQYCFQCEDFPCTNINEFSLDGIPHHKRTIENLTEMKEIGIGARGGETKRTRCILPIETLHENFHACVPFKRHMRERGNHSKDDWQKFL